MLTHASCSPSRTWQSRTKRLLAIVLTMSFLWLLTQVPYQLLREERIRAFGEADTEATVHSISTREEHGQRIYFVTYRYIGPDGRSRQSTAPLPQKIWRKTSPGQRIKIYYATGAPSLSRVHGETESKFRIWLREAICGEEIPEHPAKP